jgi:hypothetical protein
VAFTCPWCLRTSSSPADEAEGYCGACRAFTGRLDGPEPPAREYLCGACGTRFLVPAPHPGSVWCGCGPPEPMLQVAASPGSLAADFGLRSGAALDPAAVARYIARRYGMPEFITSSHTDYQSPSPDGTDCTEGPGGEPGSDAAVWHPGYPEW